MDQERFTAWFIFLLPVLWACFLCGITLVVGTRTVSRLVVTLLVLASWIAHTPICVYIVGSIGAGLLGPYASIGAWLILSPIVGGLALVWIAHLGALISIWQSSAERAKLRWALVFPGSWLLIGLGYLLWWITAVVSSQ